MKVLANGLQIEVDIQGRPGGQPLLMAMGLGMQLTAWPQELVDRLNELGFRVIRFDNRDAGLSEGFDPLGVPNLLAVALRHAMGLPVAPAYTMADMANDAVGVLDALGLESAHVCGASMGGMIAQTMAALHPRRVRSLTLMMTSSGARSLPQPRLQVRQALLRRPPKGASLEARAAHLEKFFRLVGSPGYPPELLRRTIVEALSRADRPAGAARQLVAIAAQGDRSSLLARITAPTCVLHGELDPLIPVAAAPDLVRKIAGARAEVFPGMGHDLPPALLPQFARSIEAVAHRAPNLV